MTLIRMTGSNNARNPPATDTATMDSQRHQLRGPPPQRSQHHQSQKAPSLTPAQQRVMPLAKCTIFPITRLRGQYPPSLPANIHGYAAMDDFDGPNHWLKNDNFTESYRLWSFFEHILTSNEDEVVLDNKKIIPSLTSWKMFSELRTLLWIAAESASDPVYLNHTVFPATVVSCSGFSVRIIQAIVNFYSNKVSIRMSEIVNLKGGMQANPDEVKTVLAWLIGEPVGKTQ
ncbi:unnamed protein product [Clonostachys chloroleuca]|uniref:Uncharacterized protein n=1 Tax=Clonostachys chloroleuca TaxID=1926264 RepID=A0AA35LQQ1_9HYPO|nr:unnamed protein product [Clonostachys chloroleuca]